MKKKLEVILLILKEEYEQRQELIEDNIKDIKNTPITKETIDVKLELDDLNKDLLKLNDSNKKLQDAINNYIETHLNLFENNDNMTYEKCLKLTIMGIVQYNELNPYFYDDNFYNDLLKHYIKREEYEKCEKIKRLRFNLSN